MLVWPELAAGGQQGRLFVAGVVALQLACLGWALGTLYTKRMTSLGAPFAVSAMQMLLGGVMMMIGIGTVSVDAELQLRRMDHSAAARITRG